MGSKWEAICPHCGAKYSELRTGLTFGEVRGMLWVYSDDSNEWQYKRRNTVLGKWCQIKQEMWAEHLYCCEQMAEEQILNDKDTTT